ncbi:5'-3' exonuclease [Candidatus Parcubacteria bacterium]|nr:MAG: 5'-3' exonuclease [Candidatus Parcubacteria bacterium]
METRKTLLLIDANSLIHRAFHALPPLTGRAGEPAQALYGVASILIKLWREGKPDYAAALFDRPEPTMREERYPAYKAQRPPTPDSLVRQIVEARNLFRAFGVRTLEKAGAEADDLIATLAQRFQGTPSLGVIILTGDKDALQLVMGDAVVVRVLRKGVSESDLYSESTVRETYGLSPSQLVDYKALVGDPSDNIKGVPGIGPKTATELLTRFGTLDRIYARLDLDPKLKRKLESSKKEAELARFLVTLNREVDTEVFTLEDLALRDGRQGAETYLESLGFESLVKRMRKERDHRKSDLGRKQGNMF